MSNEEVGTGREQCSQDFPQAGQPAPAALKASAAGALLAPYLRQLGVMPGLPGPG